MKKSLKILLIFAICLAQVLLVGNTNMSAKSQNASAQLQLQDLNYAESLREIRNVDSGFYRAVACKLTKNSDSALQTKDFFKQILQTENFIHLRIGLEDFSTNAGGTDIDITPSASDALQKTFDELRLAGVSAIIRFSYNVNGDTKNGKYCNNEPSINLIKRHIKSLGTVISINQDVILGVETGMLGPWGEQHSTLMGDEKNVANYFNVIDSWLNAVPKTMYVSTRRPLYFRHWANTKYKLNLTADNIGDFNVDALSLTPAEKADFRRIGCYNDGYLGSSTDWGTYVNRRQETKWLSGQTQTLFGGEVIEDYDNKGIGEFNNVNFLEVEAVKTRTSYLNIEWNYDKVISVWQNNIYNGADQLYKNAGVTEFQYVKNHLGYRLYLTESNLSKNVDLNSSRQLNIKGKLRNVGFANVVGKKKAQIVLVKAGDAPIILDSDYCVNNINGASVGEYDFSVDVPSSTPLGQYSVYIKLTSIYDNGDNNSAIQFANVASQYNEQLAANLLGAVNIQKSKPDEPTVDPDEPTVDPDEPTVDPDEPTVDPDEPVVDPDEPIKKPDKPIDQQWPFGCNGTPIISFLVLGILMVLKVKAI